jgi:hypothetical protein
LTKNTKHNENGGKKQKQKSNINKTEHYCMNKKQQEKRIKHEINK